MSVNTTCPQRRLLLAVHRYGDPLPHGLPATKNAREGVAASLDAIQRKGLVEEFAPSQWRLTEAGRKAVLR